MTAFEIARRMAELEQPSDAAKAYCVALKKEWEKLSLSERMEAALFVLQFSEEEYRVSFDAFLRLYGEGAFQEEIISLIFDAFYEPNIEELRSRYDNNCRLLEQYPYLFQKTFPDFEQLPLMMVPYDEESYIPFNPESRAFLPRFEPAQPAVRHHFFKNLDQPIFAEEVYSQYELQYLVDNVRKSEWVARENHIYLYYPSWSLFCAYLQVLNLGPILSEEKIVFLIGEERAYYPIDFKEKFGIDYSLCQLKPVAIREVQRLILHGEYSYHNGGDFFTEIFDSHPNCFVREVMFADAERAVDSMQQRLSTASSLEEAKQALAEYDPERISELFLLKAPTRKDLFVAWLMEGKEWNTFIDPASRIVPAVLFQPHFGSTILELEINAQGKGVFYKKMREDLHSSGMFEDFAYIKSFFPVRRFTTSYGSTLKFLLGYEKKRLEDAKKQSNCASENSEVEEHFTRTDEICRCVLNRSYLQDNSEPFLRDSVLVRFEDGKLNPKATFTALSAFLDLPYTESMTFCSEKGRHDPYIGNPVGFDPSAVYYRYDHLMNEYEGLFIEFCLQDIYRYLGYSFLFYDGKPAGMEDVMEWLRHFDHADQCLHDIYRCVFLRRSAETGAVYTSPSDEEQECEEWFQEQLERSRQMRVQTVETLFAITGYADRNGSLLEMIPKLKLDHALLEQPLYH